jgi:hypothetical protein
MLNKRETRGSGLSDQEKKLRERIARGQRDVGKRGLGRASVLDLTAYSPSFYKAVGGKNKNLFDIIPFKVSQPWYPKLRTHAGNVVGLQIGDLDYKLEVPVHRSVGENNGAFLCLREAFGKPCIICEERFKEFEKGKGDRDDALIKSLNASWRCFYNIYDYNDEKEEIKIFEVSYKMFEEQLLAETEPEDERVEPIAFSSLAHGMTIEWKGKEKSLGKSTFIEAVSFEFRERDPYSEEVVEEVYPLDKMLIIPTYEIVQAAYFGIVEGEEEEEPVREKKAISGRRLPGRATKQEEEEVEEESECPAGMEFGKDFNESSDCMECEEDTMRRCMEASETEAGYERNMKKPEKLRRFRR